MAMQVAPPSGHKEANFANFSQKLNSLVLVCLWQYSYGNSFLIFAMQDLLTILFLCLQISRPFPVPLLCAGGTAVASEK